YHLLRDTRLDVEDLGQHRVIPVRPDMTVVRDPDQLRSDPNPILPASLLPADTPLENVSCSELLSYLSHALLGPLVLHGCRTGRDSETRHCREAAGDLLGNAVGKVSVRWGTEVLERQDDERLRRRPFSRRGRCRSSAHDRIPCRECQQDRGCDQKPPPKQPTRCGSDGGSRRRERGRGRCFGWSES